MQQRCSVARKVCGKANITASNPTRLVGAGRHTLFTNGAGLNIRPAAPIETAQFERATSCAWFWREMRLAPLMAIALALAIGWIRPAALPWASPLLILWLVSPGIATAISRSRHRRQETLAPDQSIFLRHVARRTW